MTVFTQHASSPRVIVTRPAREAAAWVQSLSQAGLHAVTLPLIDILPVDDPSPVHQTWSGLHGYAAVMFVSANAVLGFFASKSATDQWVIAQSAIKNIAHQRAWATGPGTVQALQQAGVPAELIDAPPPEAAQFDSEALWQRVGSGVQAGQRVLIVRGSDGQAVRDAQGNSVGVGRDWLSARLTQAGVVVDFVVAYQRACPQLDQPQQQLAHSAARDGSVWLFSSSEAIANLRVNLSSQDWSAARAVATHARIVAAAKAAGFGVVCESRPTLADIVGSIESMR
jgi:uroporphyrinogen-III synthase